MKKTGKTLLKAIHAEFLPAKLRFLRRMILTGVKLTPYIEISGFLSEAEAQKLLSSACGLKEKSPIIVEIGSHLGKSSYVLAKALQEKGGGKLYCIDPFDGAGDITAVAHYKKKEVLGKKTLFQQFMRNVKKNKLTSYIHPIQGLSHEVVKNFPELHIDMIFIDGNHDWECVRQDFLDWVPKIKPGGVLAMHDVFATPFDDHYDGPWRVVKEFILDNPKWIWFQLVDSLAVAIKRAD